MVVVGTNVPAVQGEREHGPVQGLLGQWSPLLEAFAPSSDRPEKPAGQAQTRQDVLAAPWGLGEH